MRVPDYAALLVTLAALAVLVDEGKLKWDDPVAKHLPELQLFDPYASRELTVRDLLCHRAGLDRGDLLWYAGGELSRDEILRRLRFLKPSWSFRSKYGYQNICFLAAGQLVPRVRRVVCLRRTMQSIVNQATPSASRTRRTVAHGRSCAASIGPAGVTRARIHCSAAWRSTPQLFQVNCYVVVSFRRRLAELTPGC